MVVIKVHRFVATSIGMFIDLTIGKIYRKALSWAIKGLQAWKLKTEV